MVENLSDCIVSGWGYPQVKDAATQAHLPAEVMLSSFFLAAHRSWDTEKP